MQQRGKSKLQAAELSCQAAVGRAPKRFRFPRSHGLLLDGLLVGSRVYVLLGRTGCTFAALEIPGSIALGYRANRSTHQCQHPSTRRQMKSLGSSKASTGSVALESRVGPHLEHLPHTPTPPPPGDDPARRLDSIPVLLGVLLPPSLPRAIANPRGSRIAFAADGSSQGGRSSTNPDMICAGPISTKRVLRHGGAAAQPSTKSVVSDWWRADCDNGQAVLHSKRLSQCARVPDGVVEL